jgi:ATP/maltotriose-dependent transcriptional regulator MalT
MLETIREFGLEQLAAAGEEAATRNAHAAWCLALAEEAEPALLGPEQGRWLDRLAAEHGNLRTALAWSIEGAGAAASPETALRLAGALWLFWHVRGHFQEGRTWLERALAMGDGAEPAVQAKALTNLGNIATDQSDYPRASALYERALALYRTIDDPNGIAAALNNLGLVAFEQGDFARAAAFHEESLQVRRTRLPRSELAIALSNLGDLANAQGDYERAQALHEEALDLRRELGNTRRIAQSCLCLGLVARNRGDLEAARRWAEEGLALFRSVGEQNGTSDALHDLGEIARRLGHTEEAATRFAESLRLRRETGARRGIAECFEGLAAVAWGQGDGETAIRLLAAAQALREAIGSPRPDVDRAALDRLTAAAAASLGAAGTDQTWTAGHALPLDVAVAEAAAVADRARPLPPTLARGVVAGAPLTARELDVLRLLALGKSNQEIAMHLFVSPATARTHVDHIFTKLGVHDRAEAVDHAHRYGLV